MEIIQCSKCGTEINEGEKFCKKCGEKTIYFKEEPEKEGLNKNKIIIIGVSVAAIIILAAIGIICSKGNTKKEGEEIIKVEATEKIEENQEAPEENIPTEKDNKTEQPAVSENKTNEESVKTQPPKEEPTPASPQKEEYVKYTVNGNIYQSPFCDFSYTVPVGWTMLNEQQISEIIAPPTEKSIYEFVAQDNENGVLLKVLVEKTDNANMTVKDYMNYVMVGATSSGMKKISDNKTKEIAGKIYDVLEIGADKSDTRINCYIRKKDDRMICIMATYNAGKEDILERDINYFKEF